VSPEDSERLLVRPLERELQSLEGLKEMNGVAMQNAAMIYLDYQATTPLAPQAFDAMVPLLRDTLKRDYPSLP
jgi:multidrug efflux pump subunit AcrB